MAFKEEMMEYALKRMPGCIESDTIPDTLFEQYCVNRGLRDLNGKGVLTGLTNISKVVSFENRADGSRVPCEGQLWYRGYNVKDLVQEALAKGFGFERTTYLLLFGEKADDMEMEEFRDVLARNRNLPTNFTRDVIMKAPTKDIMNSMMRSILTLASYDESALETDIPHTIMQCLQLIGTFPMLAVYAYHAYNHVENLSSMYIHRPDPDRSAAENILMMLRPNKKYDAIEAIVLDICLMLHMEHGGGNNSTFTTRVVTSSGSDTYSAIAAAMASLKGPRHGGANLKVMDMMDDIRAHIRDWNDEEEIEAYLAKILAGETFDHKGLIYGMGHAVYSISDPREKIFKNFVKRLAESKKQGHELALYENVEKIAPKLIAKKRKIYKGVSPNVDFYSGFCYSMLGIPKELYTPLFAIARISGWSAHRLEELVGTSRIIRPAYMSVMEEKEQTSE